MKNKFITAILLSTIYCLSSFAGLSNFDLNEPIGWGTVNKKITGGNGGESVTVSTSSDLEKYLKSDNKYIIYVKGAVEVNTMISVQVNNKTIYGLPGSYLFNKNRNANGSGILYLKSGSDNIVMRNMTFKSAGAYDCNGNDNLCIDGTTNIWIDHCDFQDGVDGNFDCKNGSDYVCVTWCRFRYLLAPLSGKKMGTADHRYPNLWGSLDTDTEDSGHLNTTFMFCWWDEGCKERMPRVKFGKIHILNCLYNSTSSNYCCGIGNDANIYVEKSAFIGIRNPYKDYSKRNAKGYITFDDCLFIKSDEKSSTATSSFKPSIYYSLTGINSNLVEKTVSNSDNGAGATLTISENNTETFTSKIDSEAPVIVNQSIMNNAVNVKKNTSDITFTFNEEVDMKNASIILNENAIKEATIDKNTITIPLSLDYAYSYELVIDGVSDNAGNKSDDIRIKFTAADFDCTPSDKMWVVGDINSYDKTTKPVLENSMESQSYYIWDKEKSLKIEYKASDICKVTESDSIEMDNSRDEYNYALSTGKKAPSDNANVFIIPTSGKGKLEVGFKPLNDKEMANVVITPNLKNSNAGKSQVISSSSESLSFDYEGDGPLYVYSDNEDMLFYYISWSGDTNPTNVNDTHMASFDKKNKDKQNNANAKDNQNMSIYDSKGIMIDKEKIRKNKKITYPVENGFYFVNGEKIPEKD